MRIAIDARLNAYRTGGIPQYTRQLMVALAACAVDEQIVSLQHHEQLRPLVVAPNVRRHPLFTPPHHRFESWLLPLELLPVRPSILHCPDFIAPRYRPCPAVVTIHDLTFLRYPEILDDQAAAYYRRVGASAAHADAVIAVSETTRQDIAQFLDLPIEQIEVIYEAAAPLYAPITQRPGEVRVLAATPLVAGTFMLFVSTLEPRKNLPTLLQALRICIDRRPDRPYRLVIAGARGWRDGDIFTTVRDLRLSDHVLFAGRVGQYDLRWLYNACRFYVNPSLYEGFGLPLLEAMACGAACIASASSSLPEIGGDAAIYVPPLDPVAWADTIESLWDDQQRCEELGRSAMARAARFSWHQAAQATLAMYRRVVAGAPVQPAAVETTVTAAPIMADRLTTCGQCGAALVATPAEGTITVGASTHRHIAPRAWVCHRCGHVELLAVPASVAAPVLLNGTLASKSLHDESHEPVVIAASPPAPGEPVPAALAGGAPDAGESSLERAEAPAPVSGSVPDTGPAEEIQPVFADRVDDVGSGEAGLQSEETLIEQTVAASDSQPLAADAATLPAATITALPAVAGDSAPIEAEAAPSPRPKRARRQRGASAAKDDAPDRKSVV